MRTRRSRPSISQLGPALLALTVTTAGIVVVAAAPAAHASHYAFDRVPVVSASERRALGRAGIFDTSMLLDWTASWSKRDWLAQQTGIDFDRLTALATQCDLMRVEGIGPSMVEALQKAGVQDSQTLAASRAAPVLAKLQVATRGMSVHSRLPTEDTLHTWIVAARRLRPLLEGVPEAEPLR